MRSSSSSSFKNANNQHVNDDDGIYVENKTKSTTPETRTHNHHHHNHYYVNSPCIVYSMGSGQRFAFEERVRTLAPGCEIHTFDPTTTSSSKETDHPHGKEFYDQYHDEYGFGGVDSTNDGRFPVKSLATIMKELNHTHVDYLKVDVEGYEWDFLSHVDWNTTKVGQILVELHPLKGWSSSTSLLSSLNGSTTSSNNTTSIMTAMDMNQIFNKLEYAGYRLISLEPVTYTCWGQVEVVFLRKDWDPSGNW